MTDRHSRPGSYLAAMVEQRAWLDADELAALIAEQAAELRRDGAYPLAPSDPHAVVMTPRHPVQPAEGGFVNVAETVAWVNQSRDERASVEWQPSLVRLGQRPRVTRAVVVADGDIARELAAAKARLRGRKGKSRILLKAKIAKLERAAAFTPADSAPVWRPPVVPAAPVVERILRQADYAGFTGADLSYRPTESTIERPSFTVAELRQRMLRAKLADAK